MGTRIITKDEYGRKCEFFYKTVSKEIRHIPTSRKLNECRLDVDIEKINDIKKIRIFLDNLELSMKSV